MIAAARAVAQLGGVGVLLAFAPWLDAVFTVPKLAVLWLFGAAGLLLLPIAELRRPAGSGPSALLGRLGATTAGRVLLGALLGLFAVFAISWLGAALRGTPTPYAPLELLRHLGLVGLAAATVVALLPPPGSTRVLDEEAARRLLSILTAAAALVAALGLVQHLTDSRRLLPVISLPGSTFGNRNLAAEAIALCLPLAAALIAVETARGPRRLAMVALALELAYLAATRTRGAWLGAAIGLGFFVVVQRPRLRPVHLGVGLAALVAVALLVVVPPRARDPRNVHDTKRFASGSVLALATVDPTAPATRTRLGLWRRTLTLYREHPLVGIGPGNWVIELPRVAEPGASRDDVIGPMLIPKRPHQDLLERLSEQGPLGPIALLAIHGALIALALRGRRLEPLPRALTAAGAATWLALLGCGLTGFPLALPGTVGLAGLALGLALAAGGTDRPAPTARGSRAALVATAASAVLVLGLVVERAPRELLSSYWLRVAERSLTRAPPGHPERAAATRRALAALERAERVLPGQVLIGQRTAYVALAAGEPERAVDAAQRALGREPYASHSWALLAQAHLAAGRAREALEAAVRARTLLEDFPRVLWVIREAARRTKQPELGRSAEEALRRLAEKNPEAKRLADAP